ncbi:Gfo/Idh/MocA family protein [Tabrizicola aquatica]|uniref:Gfo/Idh/MocA family protein n=1 Tax=Tabrizicola aquatica TaxID=909926 RepID=UPI000CD001F8|nr:Gfo/Idh/MocA family oxidoreductase [Tabrizicola aquatica]
MRVLVIGSGSIGRRHHDNLQALGASSRLVSWREAGLGGALAAMTDARAVVLATATDIRLPLIEAAAARNLPLYIEKPLAFRPEEVEAIAAVAAPVADRSMLGYMMRYHPAVRALAGIDLTDVFQFALSIGHDVTQWRQNWRFSDSYAAKAEGGGVLLDLCHELDLAACLFPGLQVARVESLGHPAFPGVDFASRISLHRKGLVGDVSMDYLTPLLHRRTTLRGTERMHDFDLAAQVYRVTEPDGPRGLDLPLERNAMFLDAMRDFLALAFGGPTLGNPLMPRLDLCLPSARLVAQAWAMRTFVGEITKEIP